MASLDELIAQIPIRHNLFSYIIFTGFLVGFLLAVTIWLRTPLRNRALRYYGFLMFCLSILSLDTFLCYTGWMKYTLHWNDSTEPLTLLLAPLLYLSMRFLILRKPLPFPILVLHFLPAILYALSQVGYYMEPLSVKYNAYKGAYFYELPFAEVPQGTEYGYQKVKEFQRWLLILSFIFYGTLSIRLWSSNHKTFRNPAANFRISKYRFVLFVLMSFFTTLSIVLVVYFNYEDDGGDHYIVLFVGAIILSSAVAFLSESRFFQHAWLIDKYETSSSRGQEPNLEEVRRFAAQESFFCSQNPTLKKLAEAFGTHPNTLSRLINQETDGNFNDFINSFRIRLAIDRLKSEEYRNHTIEGIGQSVGFRSKSSFYQAFKKQVGMSPSAYLKSVSQPD